MADTALLLKQAREALQNVLTYTRQCDFLPGAAEAVRAIDAALSAANTAVPAQPTAQGEINAPIALAGMAADNEEDLPSERLAASGNAAVLPTGDVTSSSDGNRNTKTIAPAAQVTYEQAIQDAINALQWHHDNPGKESLTDEPRKRDAKAIRALKRILSLPAPDTAAIRNAALEEAHRIVWNHPMNSCFSKQDICDAIRNLQSSPQGAEK